MLVSAIVATLVGFAVRARKRQRAMAGREAAQPPGPADHSHTDA